MRKVISASIVLACVVWLAWLCVSPVDAGTKYFDDDVDVYHDLHIGHNATVDDTLITGAFRMTTLGVSAAQVFTADASGVGTWQDPAVSDPAGSDTQVQYNDGGTLAGCAEITWDKTDGYLTAEEIRAYDSDGLKLGDNALTGGVFITDGGLVGIGTHDFSPTNALTVKGDADCTGNLTISSGNIVVSGTVDGRDVAADGTALDAVEALTDSLEVQAGELYVYDAGLSAWVSVSKRTFAFGLNGTGNANDTYMRVLANTAAGATGSSYCIPWNGYITGMAIASDEAPTADPCGVAIYLTTTAQDTVNWTALAETGSNMNLAISCSAGDLLRARIASDGATVDRPTAWVELVRTKP